jgi:hypothetical protein
VKVCAAVKVFTSLVDAAVTKDAGLPMMNS